MEFFLKEMFNMTSRFQQNSWTNSLKNDGVVPQSFLRHHKKDCNPRVQRSEETFIEHKKSRSDTRRSTKETSRSWLSYRAVKPNTLADRKHAEDSVKDADKSNQAIYSRYGPARIDRIKD